jgi:hypothetical protein
MLTRFGGYLDGLTEGVGQEVFDEEETGEGVRRGVSRAGDSQGGARVPKNSDGWDNAGVERFCAALTEALPDDDPFETPKTARRAIGKLIDVWYTREWRHSLLGFRSPVQCETSGSGRALLADHSAGCSTF